MDAYLQSATMRLTNRSGMSAGCTMFWTSAYTYLASCITRSPEQGAAVITSSHTTRPRASSGAKYQRVGGIS